MKIALITGATGFIGRALVAQLRANYEIRVLSHHKISDDCDKNYSCDLDKLIIPVESFIGVDTVFHLAGVAHDNVRDFKMEKKYTRINVESTLKIAKLAVAAGVKRFVFISSVKAAGSPEKNICFTEKQQREPDDAYGNSKRQAELELLMVKKTAEIHISIIRPALVYGPYVKGNLKLMLNGIKKGWFPPLPYTSNSRSMVFLDDLVNAIILAAENDHANGEIFNVTDGKQYSSREIYNEICLAYGKKIPGWSIPIFVFRIAAKIGDVINMLISVPFDTLRYHKLLGDDCFSSEKIRHDLGFVSNATLKDALPSMIDFNKSS